MRLGDHIRILKDGRWNHAIACGDQTAIHLAPEPDLTGGRLRRTFLPELLDRSERVEVVTHRERVYPGKAVVARAFSRLSEPAFRAMFADSEQFATWCKTGQIPFTTARNEVVVEAPRANRAPTPRKAAAPRAVVRKAAVRKAAAPGKKAPPKKKTKPAGRKAAAPRRRAAPSRGGRVKKAAPAARGGKTARRPAPRRTTSRRRRR